MVQQCRDALAARPVRTHGHRRRTSEYFPPATTLRGRWSKRILAAKTHSVRLRTSRETDRIRLQSVRSPPPAIAAKSVESRASLHWPLSQPRQSRGAAEKLQADRNPIRRQRCAVYLQKIRDRTPRATSNFSRRDYVRIRAPPTQPANRDV